MNSATVEKTTPEEVTLEKVTVVFDFAKLHEFAKLTERKKRLESALKKTEKRLAELEPGILEQMADVGMSNSKINGRTYYMRRDLYAGPREGCDKTSVIASLKWAGLGDYVSETYNSNSLAAYVCSCKQEAENGDTLTAEQIRDLLPEPLRAVLRVGENFRLGSRKS